MRSAKHNAAVKAIAKAVEVELITTEQIVDLVQDHGEEYNGMMDDLEAIVDGFYEGLPGEVEEIRTLARKCRQL